MSLPSPLDVAWLVPAIPLIGSSFIALLLFGFSRTLKRLSKPVAVFLITCLGTSAAVSYALLARYSLEGDFNEVLLERKFRVVGQLLEFDFVIDNFTIKAFTVISTIALVLMIAFHYLMKQKKEYVRLIVSLGFLISFIFTFTSVHFLA